MSFQGSQRRKQLHLGQEGRLPGRIEEVEVGKRNKVIPGFITSPVNFLLASPPGPYLPSPAGASYWVRREYGKLLLLLTHCLFP